MKIIKEGTLEPREFTCQHCGCVFEANNKEYQYRKECLYPDTIDIYYCDCPQCNYEVEIRTWSEN